MPDIEIRSFYDLEDLSSSEIKSLGLQPLLSLLEEAESEQKELSLKYLNGDRDEYPPSWYDNYVHPINCIVNDIKDVIDEIRNDEESASEEY
tara:strand:- start:532 stop:807 length:276 start_codon:yes stop_codon:yes gene_type:complete